MELKDFIPVWDELTQRQQQTLLQSATKIELHKGEVLRNDADTCVGLLPVLEGQLRAYTCSEDGKEITLFRLLSRDICLFSAACMMKNLQIPVCVSAEKESLVWRIPAEIYHQVMAESAPLANFTNELLSNRVSEVMWLLEQVMWRKMDARLAEFLLNEASLDESMQLTITHEMIASHLGTAREVITRMLKYFQNEGWVHLTRGKIELTNPKALEKVAA